MSPRQSVAFLSVPLFPEMPSAFRQAQTNCVEAHTTKTLKTLYGNMRNLGISSKASCHCIVSSLPRTRPGTWGGGPKTTNLNLELIGNPYVDPYLDSMGVWDALRFMTSPSRWGETLSILTLKTFCGR